MKKTNIKTVTLATALMLLLSLPFAAFAQYEENRGLFGRGGSSADYDYSGGESLMRQGEPNTYGTITNDSFGAPLGSGVAILLAAGAGYAVVRRKRSRKNTMLLLACVALLGFTQCKKGEPQGSEPEVKTVGITLKVGGNSGSRHTINTTTGAVRFEEHDLIYVGNGGKYIGTLECNNSGVFTGDINEPVDNTEMYFYFVGGLTPSTTPSAGSTSSFTVDISDQSSQMPVLSCNHVTYKSGTSSYSCKLQNQCALLKFTTASTSAPVHVGGLYTEAKIDFANKSITNNGTMGFIALNSACATEKWAVLLPQTSFPSAECVIADQGYTISMTAIEADAFLTGDAAISFGSTSSHHRYLQWAAGNLTLEDGDHVYGTLGGNYKISIDNGATVTLDGVTIDGVNNSSYSWAGITCNGDATIILSGENTVKGFYEDFPGIQVGPKGTTLTIQGNGTLNASNNGYATGIGGGWSLGECGNIVIAGGTITARGGNRSAGIGGGNASKCGYITISGGNVTAYGGLSGAGIGAGYLSGAECGDITISGGNVTAYGNNGGAGIGVGQTYSKCGNILISGGSVTATGDSYAAGIGCGASYSSCGTITIENTVTRVKATKGSNATNSIGESGIGGTGSGTCGMVTFGGVLFNPITVSAGTYGLLTLAISTTSSTNDTWTLTPISAPEGVVAVNLGLPSGRLWASCNIGATTPEGYGDYFAWGEVEPYYSSLSPLTWKSGKEAGYAWASYRYDNSAGHDGSSFSKYIGSDYSVLQTEDDAATYNWGLNWRMPTNDELQELIDNTDAEWTTINNVTGLKLKKKTDASVYIFLPSGVGFNGIDALHNNTAGEYWSSTAGTGNYAKKASFNNGGTVGNGVDGYRDLGRNVRAVWAN